MKRIKYLLLALAILFTISSCDYCYYGEVFVTNKTGAPIYTDVSYQLGADNFPRFMYDNEQSRYDMNYGTVYIMVSLDGRIWDFETIYLDPDHSAITTWKYDNNENLILEVAYNY